MNEIQVFDGLKAKEENGKLMFDAETAAIGIGITDESKGVKYVRWNRVNKYLFATSGEKVKRGDFITEPQLYKLAIKANSQQAENFQNWIAEEVVPSLRKTGSYQMKPMSAMETLKLHSAAFVEVDQRLDDVTEKVDTYIENQQLNATDYSAISTAVNNKVHAYATINRISKSSRSPLFKDINSQIKQVTGAGNRSRIKSKDYDKVIEFIGIWEPSTATKSEVMNLESDL